MIYAATFEWVMPQKNFATYPQKVKTFLHGAYEDSRIFCVT